MQPDYKVINASAGSGKTYALVQNLLTICLKYPSQADKIRNILALTFTNKAANEMKHRIIDWLKKFSLETYETNNDLINIQEKLKNEGIAEGSEGDSLDLQNSILDFAQPLCMEIERSIDYFRSTFGGEQIKHVLLSGGSANIPNLTKTLTEKLNVKTEIINPFLKIEFNKKNIDVKNIESIKPIAATAIGLGLRTIGDKK